MRKYEHYLELFTNYLNGLGYKEDTIESYLLALTRFFEYLRKNNKHDVREVQRDDIYGFVEYMKEQKTYLGNLYSRATINHMIGNIKHFFKFLYRNEVIIVNPYEELSLQIKRIEKRREIFTFDEINTFLDSIDILELHGERDRAIFELMYSSGLRISEVVKLKLNDIDLKERIISVWKGKGDRDRFVPFSDVACKFLTLYIENDRKKYLSYLNVEEEKTLFLSTRGRIQDENIRGRFRKHLEESGIKREGLTVHSIRHSCATHLLEAGADVRYVAELLGHENMETTIKYTHLKIESLKRVYKSTHPRENKYYEEVDKEYLDNIDKLKKELISDRIRRKENN